MMKKTALILLIGIMASCGQKEQTNQSAPNSTETINSSSQNKTKNAIVFINAYVENCNKLKQSMPVMEWANSSDLCTVNFKAELKKIVDGGDNESGLEFDPIFNAQDYPEKGFILDSFDETTNYLIVRGIDNEAFKITMKLVNENGKWLVNGCGCVNIPDDKRSF